MARQAPESATALANRLRPFLDTSPKAQVEGLQASWQGGIGEDISDIRTVMVHATAGWPTRDKATSFVNNLTRADSEFPGISPHFYMSLDGRVFQIFAENRLSWHAVQLTRSCIGVETGNLLATGAPGNAGNWAVATSWVAVTANAEDVPGAKLYACRANNEVVVCYWSTAVPATPDGKAEKNSRMVHFSEAQYRSWRLLARYLAEVWRVPRHLPLRPHMLRGSMWSKERSELYRKIVNAEPVKEVLLSTQLNANPINCTTFDTDDEATFRTRYDAQRNLETWHVYVNGVKTQRQHWANHFWTVMFNSYRGFLGHGYPGSVRLDDHNCPGSLFDFHRFARDIWDFWWFPFDLIWFPFAGEGTHPADPLRTTSARRDYGRTQPELLEYYFDAVPANFTQRTRSGFFGVGEEIRLPKTPGLVDTHLIPVHFYGYWHGGMHFELAHDTPIYAAAGGQIVAARFPAGYPAGQDRDAAGSNLGSTRFVLLRHEVFHERVAGGKRINYDREPTYVYSLYMHLGAPAGMSFQNIVDANPVWLNRALAKKKEYDAGLAFQPTHAAPAAQWAPWLTRWQSERQAYDALLTQLQAGATVVFPEGDIAIPVSLGDFLGNAGHLSANQFAIHFEIFASQNVDAKHFQGHAVNPAGAFYDPIVEYRVTPLVQSSTSGGVPGFRNLRASNPALAASLFGHTALQFKSEWSLTAADFPSGGWSANQPFMWWQDVVPAMNASPGLPAGANLPPDANVWHFHPLGFMSWLNGVTWTSELSKYRLPSPSQVDARPPRRR